MKRRVYLPVERSQDEEWKPYRHLSDGGSRIHHRDDGNAHAVCYLPLARGEPI
jgi:hypothetical protein